MLRQTERSLRKWHDLDKLHQAQIFGVHRVSEATLGAASWFLMMSAYAAVFIVPFWFIFAKAGYSRWLSLLLLIPLVNVGILYFLAFSSWPAVRAQHGE
jgi:ABC-type anion transport system duplicated permease subunit